MHFHEMRLLSLYGQKCDAYNKLKMKIAFLQFRGTICFGQDNENKRQPICSWSLFLIAAILPQKGQILLTIKLPKRKTKY